MTQPTYLIREMNQLSGVYEMVHKALSKGPVVVTLGREKRNTDQNAKLWAMLNDVSRQKEWYGKKYTPEDWKHIFTACLKDYDIAPGINGGFVVLGTSTSNLSKAKFGELIELIYAFGAEHQIRWSEPAMQAFEQYREAQQ